MSDRGRKHDVAAVTIPRRRMGREVKHGRIHLSMIRSDLRAGYSFPKAPVTRGDCANVPRPCPFVSCRNHLFLDVTASGSLKLNFPDLEPDQLRESCALDVADRGGTSLEDVAAAVNVTPERARQVEESALRKTGLHRAAFLEYVDEDTRATEAQIAAVLACAQERSRRTVQTIARALDMDPRVVAVAVRVLSRRGAVMPRRLDSVWVIPTKGTAE